MGQTPKVNQALSDIFLLRRDSAAQTALKVVSDGCDWAVSDLREGSGRQNQT